MSRRENPVLTALPLFRNCTGVVIGVSGGPDSMALLSFFLKAKEKGFPYPFVCATLDHGLRPESTQEAEGVGRFCEEHGVAFETERANLSEREPDGDSTENAARKIRYEFFGRVKEKYGYSHIATAHNADDNLETVLLNLIRGCGPDGLTGITPLRKDNNTIRPLLGYRKAELTAYCEENGIPYYTDRSNADPRYRRNFIRLNILPLLKELNPSVTEAAGRLSALAGEEREFLEEESRLALSRVRDGEGLSRKGLHSLHPALLGRVLRLYAEEITGESPDYRTTEDFRTLVKDGKTSDKITFGGKDFRLTYTALTAKNETPVSFEPFSPRPGDNPLPNGILTIEKKDGYGGEADCISFRSLETVLVRPRLPGDRMHTPQGYGKLLKRLYTDKKIPASVRPSLPLLTEGGRILWAAFIGTDPDFLPGRGEAYYKIRYISQR